MLWGRYASRRGEARFPTLWDGRVFSVCPSIQGPSGLRLWDTSGRGNHGTLTNMDAPTDLVRSAGQYALDFDGSNDYVQLSRAANIQTLCEVSTATIAIWVYPRSTSRNAYIADWNASGASESARIEMSGGNMTAGRIGGSVFSGFSGAIQTSAAPALNQWHHIAIARTSSGQKLWWNGVLDATNTTGIVTNTTTTIPTIGRGGQINSLYANAIIDDIIIYNRAISDGEARLLARRRGVSYEMPRDVVEGSSGFQAAWARRQGQIIGGGV